MNLPSLFRRKTQEVEREQYPMAFNDWAQIISSFEYQGVRYTLPGAQQEDIGGGFQSLTQQAYKANGVVFACILTRMLLFSEARIRFRQLRSTGPGNLFGTPDLQVIETPWPGATTGDLLSRALVDADLAGNAFLVKRPGSIRRLRPDWVTIVLGSFSDPDLGAWDTDADVLGYIYQPGGKGSGREPENYLAADVCHFAPIPDPEAQFRGMSWLSPIIREISADKSMTDHKLAFMQNGATPNLVLKMDLPKIEDAQPWIDMFKANHEGAANAYKTIFLGSGADATVVGMDMKQLDFKVTQGAGETRIAAAARVPPIIVGLSEGLAAATYSNYGQARRAFADATMRPLWRNFCGSLARIIPPPPNAELWYDDRDIAFLQEDQKDAAEIIMTKSTSIRTLVDGGFEPDTAVDAITSGDLSRLVHSGLTSVQLLPPGTTGEPPALDTDTDPTAPPPPVPTGATAVKSAREAELELEVQLARWMRDVERDKAQQPLSVNVTTPAIEITDGAIQSHVTLELPPGEGSRIEFAEGSIASHVSVEPSRTEIQEGAIRVDPGDVHVHEGAFQTTVEPGEVRVEQGAIQSHTTVEASPVTVEPVNVTVEPARTEIQDGAIQSHVTVESPEVTVEPVSVTVEPARTEFGEGAIQANVTVEPTEVTVEPVSVNVEPARMEIAEGAVQVTVEPSDVTVEPVNVTVEPARTEFAEGAIQSHVTVEPAVTEIQEGAVQVTAEPARMELQEGAITVNVEPGNVEIQEGAIEVNVEPARLEMQEGSLQVNVEPSDVQVDVHMPETEITVETRAADSPAPVINVSPTPVEIKNEVNVKTPNKKVTIDRDYQGNISEMTTEDAPSEDS